MPTDNVTIKLYPMEYSQLYLHLAGVYNSAKSFGLNSSVSHILLHDLFCRKAYIINRNSHNPTGKLRSISFKPHEARALYDELISYSNTNVVLGQIFGHLDRAMVNLGFNNKSVL